MIYLDSAATTFQKPPSVYRSVQWAMGHLGSPGRGGHPYAMRAAEAAFRCRERAAELFHVPDPERVIFTFNATHGLNIAIRSLVRRGSRVVISGYEHNSVVRPLAAIGAEVRVAHSPLFDRDAAVRAFERLIDERTDAVVVNHVSNVFGFILPVEEIADICHEWRVPLILDASQSAGVLPVDAQRLGAAFIAMPGHKGLYGPQGTGLLLASGEAAPLLYGGSGSDSRSADMPAFLPDRLEAGTHNMPGIAGLAAGIAYVLQTGTSAILRHERTLIGRMADGLSGIPGVRVFRSKDMSLQAGVLSFEIDGLSAEEAGERLGEMGIAVRAGLHCAPLAHKTVGTLARGAVRASVSAFNSQRDVSALVDAVKKLANRR